jgi:membrane associated rhomboid family serine protease
MFLPLHDSVPLRYLKAPTATYALMAAAVLVYGAVSLDILPIASDMVFAGLGLVPAQLFGEQVLPDGLPLVPSALTLVTSILIHASFLHLAGNMLFLWVFGDNVEDAMGHARFLVFFTACGVAGGVVYAIFASDPVRPLVGASGAVSGVMAAYLMLHPRVKIWGLFLNRVPLKLRAFWGIGFWALFQIGAALIGADDSTGWYAHAGGFVAGALLVVLLRRRDQPLFGRDDDAQLTGDA